MITFQANGMFRLQTSTEWDMRKCLEAATSTVHTSYTVWISAPAADQRLPFFFLVTSKRMPSWKNDAMVETHGVFSEGVPFFGGPRA